MSTKVDYDSPAAGRLANGAAWLPRESFAPAHPYAAPANETERCLLALWAQVLEIDGLGVEDDFFEFGGNSFAATALFVQIEHKFGESPPLSTMLDCPTVRLLAARIDRPDADFIQRPVIAIRQQGSRPPLFFVHAVQGHVLFVAQIAACLDAGQPVYAVQARGLEAGETPHSSFERMAEDYSVAIRRVQSKGPYRLAGYCVGSFIAIEVAQRLRASGEQVAMVLMLDPDVHPEVAPWLYWRRPDAAWVRARRPVVRAIWAVRRKIRLLAEWKMKRPIRPLSTDDARRQRAVRAGILTALKSYHPRPYDGCLVVISTRKTKARHSHRSRGWPAIAPKTEIVEIGRNHHELFRASLPAVCREIQSRLDQIGDGHDRAAT